MPPPSAGDLFHPNNFHSGRDNPRSYLGTHIWLNFTGIINLTGVIYFFSFRAVGLDVGIVYYYTFLHRTYHYGVSVITASPLPACKINTQCFASPDQYYVRKEISLVFSNAWLYYFYRTINDAQIWHRKRIHAS